MSPLYNRSMVQIRRDISRDSSVVIRHRSLISPTSPNERASAKRARRSAGGRGMGLSLYRESGDAKCQQGQSGRVVTVVG